MAQNYELILNRQINAGKKRKTLLPVYPREEAVDPADGTAEPAVGGLGLAPKAEDEVAERVFAEGQADIHEEDMLVGLAVTVLDGVPDGEHVGMDQCERLTPGCGIPQVGLLLAIDHGRATHHMPLVTGEIEPTVPLLLQTLEELVGGNITLGLQPVMMAQKLGESLEVVIALHLVGHHATLVGCLNAASHPLGDAFFGCKISGDSNFAL